MVTAVPADRSTLRRGAVRMDNLNRPTHRAVLRCRLPDGQEVTTRLDLPLAYAEEEPPERRDAWGRVLAETWLRRWLEIEVVELRPIDP